MTIVHSLVKVKVMTIVHSKGQDQDNAHLDCRNVMEGNRCDKHGYGHQILKLILTIA